jgi:hypothetical protein
VSGSRAFATMKFPDSKVLVPRDSINISAMYRPRSFISILLIFFHNRF